MDIICASICYRGYAEDEVAATLENAPKIGYRLMEIHGPLIWSVDAALTFDIDAMKAKIDASGMKCAGLYPPGWGGQDTADVDARANAIARCVEIAEGLGATHLTTSGAQRRTEPGALDRVTACVREVLQRMPAESQIKLTLEPHHGNVLEQAEDFQNRFRRYSRRTRRCLHRHRTFPRVRCRHARCNSSIRIAPLCSAPQRSPRGHLRRYRAR